jgi:hypothetical protein
MSMSMSMHRSADGATQMRRLLAIGCAATLLATAAVGPAVASDQDRTAPTRRQSLPANPDPTVAAAAAAFGAAHGLRALAGAPLVWDRHDDPTPHASKSPDLIGSVMAVYPDDPTTSGDESSVVGFLGATSGPSLSGDWAEVDLDVNGDAVDDLRVTTPNLYMDLEQDYWVTVMRWDGASWTSTGASALWRRRGDAYVVAFDWRQLGLSSVRYVFGLADEPISTWDWAPDDYVGAPVALSPASTQQPVAPVIAPSAPQEAMAVPGDASATVSWKPPANPGSAAVTGYRVTAIPGGATCETAALSCVVPGLVNQQPYVMHVVAISGAGVSPPGTTAAVVPQPWTAVVAAARRSGNVLYVDVNPNLPKKQYWKFRVYKQNPTDGSWVAKKTYRTAGSKETRTINLPKGTYKVVVLPKYGHQSSESTPVTLRK